MTKHKKRTELNEGLKVVEEKAQESGPETAQKGQGRLMESVPFLSFPGRAQIGRIHQQDFRLWALQCKLSAQAGERCSEWDRPSTAIPVAGWGAGGDMEAPG